MLLAYNIIAIHGLLGEYTTTYLFILMSVILCLVSIFSVTNCVDKSTFTKIIMHACAVMSLGICKQKLLSHEAGNIAMV